MQLKRQLSSFSQHFLLLCKSNFLHKSVSTSRNLQPRFTPNKTPLNTSARLFYGISKRSWFVIQSTDPSILTADILRMFNEMHSDGTRLCIRSLQSQTLQEWIFKEMKGKEVTLKGEFRLEAPKAKIKEDFHQSWKFLWISFRQEMWWKCFELPVSIILIEISLAICQQHERVHQTYQVNGFANAINVHKLQRQTLCECKLIHFQQLRQQIHLN